MLGGSTAAQRLLLQGHACSLRKRMGTLPPTALATSFSPLPQEVQQCLVEGPRILMGHEVRRLGNDHQATAGNTLHNHLIDPRKVPQGVFATHDEGGGLHAT